MRRHDHQIATKRLKTAKDTLMSYDVIIVSFLSGATAAGIIGVSVRNVLTKRREAEARRLSKQQELTDFLAEWKGKITADHRSNLPFVYNRELPYLQTKAAGVRNNLGELQRAKF